MIKKLSLISAAVLISGCAGTGGSDWASSNDGCQKYFSETPKDLAACRAFVAKQQVSVADNHSANHKHPLAVTQSAVGTKVDSTTGIKEFERSEQNITE